MEAFDITQVGWQSVIIPPELYQLAAVLGGGLLLGIGYMVYLYWQAGHALWQIYTVTFPQVSGDDGVLYQEKMKAVFMSLHRTLSQQGAAMALEIIRVDDYISIQIGGSTKQVCQAIEQAFSQIPDIEIRKAEYDAVIKMKSVYAKHVWASQQFHPIGQSADYVDQVIDTLASLQSAEQGGLQLLIHGVDKRMAIREAIQKIEARGVTRKRRLTDTERHQIGLFQAKLQQPLFKVKMNALGSSSPIVQSLVAVVHTLGVELNTFASRAEKKTQVFSRFIAPETPLSWVCRKAQGSYLTASEVACMFHPSATRRVRYAAAETKQVEAPPEFTTASKDTIAIGTHEGDETPMYFPARNFARHLYIVGKTGRGKSTLLTTLSADLLGKQGKNMFVFDPHGELLKDILYAASDLSSFVYFDLKDAAQERIFTTNPLFAFQKDAFDKAALRDMMLDIIQSETQEVSGGQGTGATTYQRLKRILEIAIDFADTYHAWLVKKGIPDDNARDIVHQKQLTLNDLPLMFGRPEYVKLFKVLYKDSTSQIGLYVNRDLEKHVHNPVVVDAVQTRLEQLLHPSIRLMCEGNAFSLEEAVQSDKTFLIPIPEVVYGSKGSRVLMQMLFSRIWLLKRKHHAKHMKETYLFIDEFQRAQIPAIPEIIAEGRKFKLFLTLSNQQLGQLRSDVKHAILGNMGTLISFTVAADDIGAETLAPFFGDAVTARDLAGLPPYRAYLRTEGGENKSLVTFSFKTKPVSGTQKDEGKIEHIQSESLQQYGELTKDIEQRIQKKQQDPMEWFLEVAGV